ncbi:MAG: hypothetical protein HY910_11065 [Desulfarculus sp.]|nr:hypothetical protein [Desulfarculus sp.]
MEPIRVLRPDLVVVDWGPMTLSVRAWAGGKPRPVMAAKAAAHALQLLAQLADFQHYLKLDVLDLPRRGRRPAVVAAAAEACRQVALASGVRLTPLAAVAGAVAGQVAQAAWNLGADKVVVNNGGDLALRLALGRRLLVGLPLFPGGPLGHQLSLRGGDGVGGVATSGWPGRSFSPGVAEQVAVWGADGALADAAATVLAGACRVDSPRVTRVPARELDPNTDVPEFMVTTHVDALSDDEAAQALAGGEALARRLLLALPLVGAHFSVSGRKLVITRQAGGGLLARRV